MAFFVLIPVFIVAFVVGFTLNWTRDPLRHFSGPLLASLTRLHSVKALCTGREHELLAEAHKIYGPIVRWQPNLLLINDPALLPTIYHHRSEKTPHYNSSLKGVESIVEAKSWQTHRNARLRIAAPFKLDSILQDESLIDGNISSWIKTLDQDFAGTDKVCDFSQWPHLLGHDLNMIRVMGKPLSDMDHGKDYINSLIQAAQDGAKMTHVLARLPWLRPFLLEGFLGRFLMPKAGDTSPVGQVLQFRDDIIKQGHTAPREPDKRRLMDHMMHEAKNLNGSDMGSLEIEDDVTQLLFAGTETIAHAILATILHVSRNHVCLQRLQKEIQTSIAMTDCNTTVLSSGSPLPHATLEKMPYLNACIRESLRIDPSVVSYLPRMIKPGGLDLPNGLGFIPEGTEVASSPWVIGRNEQIYGPDAKVFRPERFTDDPEWASDVLTYEFAWGYGNRRCLGKVLAMLMLRKTISEFFRNFTPEIVSMGSSEAYLLWTHKGVQLKLERALLK